MVKGDVFSAMETRMGTNMTSEAARQAFARYSNGNHPARLELGDCFAHAFARVRSEPLLVQGNDFRQTDIEAAV